jgi:hypothetical protein
LRIGEGEFCVKGGNVGYGEFLKTISITLEAGGRIFGV